MAHRLEHFTYHCDRDAMPKSRRQGRQDEADVNFGYVVGNYQRGTFEVSKVGAAHDLWTSHDHGCRPAERVIHRKAEAPDQPSLGPPRILVIGPPEDRLPQHRFEFRHGRGLRKPGLVQINLIPVLDGAQ